MNDGLPSDDQLRRIERGVQRRIDARRQLARRIGGAAVAVVLVGGGIALVRPALLQSTSAGSSAAGSAATEASGSRGVPVICHLGEERTVRVDASGLPASALTACAAAAREQPQTDAGTASAASSGTTSGSASGSASPAARTVCTTRTGALHVYAGAETACAEHDMAPYRAK